jgi:hypothetical protein
MKSMKILLLIGSMIYFGSASGQETFLMEYKYVKDKTYRYREEMKFESVQEINGQEMKAAGSTMSLIAMTVTGISDAGDITFSTSLEDMKVSTKMGSMDTTMVMKDILNKKVQTIISRKGKIIDQKMIDTVNMGNNLMDGTKSLLSSYKEFVIFPDSIKKTGDTWKDERTDTTKGTEMVNTSHLVYTLLGTEIKNDHTCVKAGFTGKTEIGGKMTQMGMEFFMEGTGEINGTVWFDKDSWIVISKETTTDQDMTMALTGQMQMTIPITSTTVSKFTLLE